MRNILIVLAIVIISCATALAAQVGITKGLTKDGNINIWVETTNVLFVVPSGIKVEVMDVNPLKDVPYSTFIKVKILEGEHSGKIGLAGKENVLTK